MYHVQSLTPDHADLPATASAANEAGNLQEEMAALRGECVALQSILYGLCIGLSQMGEVQREVIRSAFDHADRAPMGQALKHPSANDPQAAKAYASAIERMRDLIVSRIRTGF